MQYTLFPLFPKNRRKVNLKDYTIEKKEFYLQSVLRFSEGTDHTREELHYEDYPDDPSINAYDIFIPFGAPIAVRVAPCEVIAGTPHFDEFNDVIVQPNQGMVIRPRTCHYVREAGRFMVLKAKGWKFTRKDGPDGGNCRFQNRCKVHHRCPTP